MDYDEPLRQRLFSLEVSASDGKAQDKVTQIQLPFCLSIAHVMPKFSALPTYIFNLYPTRLLRCTPALAARTLTHFKVQGEDVLVHKIIINVSII